MSGDIARRAVRSELAQRRTQGRKLQSRREGDAIPLGVRRLLDLQRMAGNAAAVRLLREVDGSQSGVSLGTVDPTQGIGELARRFDQERAAVEGSLPGDWCVAWIETVATRYGWWGTPGLLGFSFVPDMPTSTADAMTINPADPDVSFGADVRVFVGPGAFRSFAGLVHTLAHEIEHVRQRSGKDPAYQTGLSDAAMEFLSEEIEIVSNGMIEEDLAAFTDDALRALAEWDRLGIPEQLQLWTNFLRIRTVVDQRLATAPTGQGVRLVDGTIVGYGTVLARYRSVRHPIGPMLGW